MLLKVRTNRIEEQIFAKERDSRLILLKDKTEIRAGQPMVQKTEPQLHTTGIKCVRRNHSFRRISFVPFAGLVSSLDLQHVLVSADVGFFLQLFCPKFNVLELALAEERGSVIGLLFLEALEQGFA